MLEIFFMIGVIIGAMVILAVTFWALFKKEEPIKDSSKDTSTCDTCHHKDACSAWIRHCTALYDDFSYSTGKCPYYLRNADVVSRSVLEQIKLERDIAIQQLNDCGISFGGKADVTSVVRCAQCRDYEEPWCMLCKRRIGAGYHSRDMAYRRPDDFCSYGKRKEVL